MKSVGLLLIALTAGNAPFDPSGHWSIRSEDRCSGSSRTKSGDAPIKGKTFQCSSYLGKNDLPKQAELDVSYNPAAHTVTLTGGPSAFPRVIPLDKNRTGISNVKLFPKTTSEAPGCDLNTYFLETVRFKDSKTMEYRYVTVNDFVPHAGSKTGCTPYLAELKKAVERRTATGFLLAMRDIDAIKTGSMQSMTSLDLISEYQGTRTLG